MSGRDYYNEYDPFAAAWLRELMAAGEIPTGDVDERSIEDVVPSDLVGYRHCHFFAGIGGWPLAMRLAGWPDDVPLWTGSAPCQPFSAAGQGAGFADERHLWPAFFWLIRQCQPRYIAGEQVASADALRWWDVVAADLESEAYTCTAVDLPAASVGAPHKRSRLFWVADAEHALGRAQCLNRQDGCDRPHGGREETHGQSRARGEVYDVADATSERHDRGWAGHTGDQPGAVERPERLRDAGLMADARDKPDGCGDDGERVAHARRAGSAEQWGRRHEPTGSAPASGPDHPWADCVWLPCTDGKARPTQPGLFPLAHGVRNRVGTLRGAGNAIVPQVAAEVLRAWREVMR